MFYIKFVVSLWSIQKCLSPGELYRTRLAIFSIYVIVNKTYEKPKTNIVSLSLNTFRLPYLESLRPIGSHFFFKKKGLQIFAFSFKERLNNLGQ